MPAYFVTGSGTDLGKTFITAALIRYFRGQGRSVDGFKPVASGFNDADPTASDAGVLLAALGRPLSQENLAAISPWRFFAALSPDMAAAREGRTIDLGAVVKACERMIAQAAEVLLIEGVGGVMTPLHGTDTALDLMARLRLPVIVVAGSYLGTLSHTLTALDVLARRDLKIAAVAVSETPGSPVPLDEAAAAIARFAGPAPVVAVPRAASDPAIAALAGMLLK